jgi:hypothetical protein
VPQGDELFLRLAASSDFATAVPEAFMMQRGLVPEAALEHWTAALNHSNEDNHNRDYQQNVNESRNGVRSGQSQRPKDKQNDSNGPKHWFNAPFSHIVRARWWPLAAQYCGRLPVQEHAEFARSCRICGIRDTLLPWRPAVV